jgi:hypothetical protein
LSNILDKAQTHVDAKKLDDATLTTYRLCPDMLPMAKQVQIACDTAKGAGARLAGETHTSGHVLLRQVDPA